MHSPLLLESRAASSKPCNPQSQQHHDNCRHLHYSNWWYLHQTVHEDVHQLARRPSTSNNLPSTCLWLCPHNLKGVREGAVCSRWTQAKVGLVNLGISSQEQSSRRSTKGTPKQCLQANPPHPCTKNWQHHKQTVPISTQCFPVCDQHQLYSIDTNRIHVCRSILFKRVN